MNKQWKNPGILLTVVLGAAALAYTFLIFVPAQRAVAQLRNEIQTRQLYVLETAQVEAELAAVQQQLSEARSYVEQQQDTLPHSVDLTRYTGELTTCATAAGVRIVRFSPQFQQHMPPLSRVPVTMSIEGELPQVFDFAARLEELPVAIWCQQFTVESQVKKSQAVRAEFELLIFASNNEKSG